MTQNTEGVVKFQVRFNPAPALAAGQVAELSAWRRILIWLELIGQTPDRYEGYGFGNISRRIEPFAAPPTRRGFVITGTQTGGVIDAQPEHYVTVNECYPARNLVTAEGPVRPSSESMTHGAIYAQDSRIHWVMHGHSPHIWNNAARLGIPITDPNVPYGTPEMSAEVQRLFRATDVRRQHIFSMGGHEDGIISFGRTAEEAGAILLSTLAKSLSI